MEFRYCCQPGEFQKNVDYDSCSTLRTFLSMSAFSFLEKKMNPGPDIPHLDTRHLLSTHLGGVIMAHGKGPSQQVKFTSIEIDLLVGVGA